MYLCLISYFICVLTGLSAISSGFNLFSCKFFIMTEFLLLFLWLLLLLLFLLFLLLLFICCSNCKNCCSTCDQSSGVCVLLVQTTMLSKSFGVQPAPIPLLADFNKFPVRASKLGVRCIIEFESEMLVLEMISEFFLWVFRGGGVVLMRLMLGWLDFRFGII